MLRQGSTIVIKVLERKMILTKVQHHNSKSLIFLSKYCSISIKKNFYYDVDDDNNKNEYYWSIDINGTEYMYIWILMKILNFRFISNKRNGMNKQLYSIFLDYEIFRS